MYSLIDQYYTTVVDDDVHEGLFTLYDDQNRTALDMIDVDGKNR